MNWTLPNPDLALHRPRPWMTERPSQPSPWPLYDAAGARALEAWAAATRPPHRLMQTAGLGVARLAQALVPQARGAWVMAGPGNNGGDAFEAAWHWHRMGRRVQVSFVGTPGRLPTDAALSFARAQAAGVPITDSLTPPEWLSPQDISLDGLLGRGLSRAPDGQLAAAVAALNQSAAPIMAIDLPSGLPGDTGALAPRAVCVQARWTLALLGLPVGLFTAQGRDVAGDIWWDDLAVSPAPTDLIRPVAWLAGGAGLLQTRPTRQHSQHKGSYGDVWVVAGAAHMGGAAVLAGRAALRAGAGRVYIVSLAPLPGLADSQFPELMQGDLEALTASRLATATVVAGCGGGQAITAQLPLLLAHSGRLVLDADALNAVAADPALQTALQARSTTVITPHPLEAARLLGCTAADVQADRLQAAASLAQRYRATVVLKGSGSVVASPDETPWILPVGNAALATPGSGDVLAGWLGGLWSQWPADRSAAEPARLAVWQHGWAAEQHSPLGLALPASVLINALG